VCICLHLRISDYNKLLYACAHQRTDHMKMQKCPGTLRRSSWACSGLQISHLVGALIHRSWGGGEAGDGGQDLALGS